MCSHSTVSSATSETNVNINDLCYIIIFLVSSATSEKKLNVNDLLYNNFFGNWLHCACYQHNEINKVDVLLL